MRDFPSSHRGGGQRPPRLPGRALVRRGRGQPRRGRALMARGARAEPPVAGTLADGEGAQQRGHGDRRGVMGGRGE